MTGRRAVRNDRFVKRTTSRLYNRRDQPWSPGCRASDFNSGLKAMRRELADGLELYGELHRYIPVLAQWNGFRVGEVDVEHHARRHGESKFGRARFWRGFLDLVTVKFLTTYTAGRSTCSAASACVIGPRRRRAAGLDAGRAPHGHGIGTRPALLAGVLLVVVAVQMLSLGLLAELSVHLRRRRDLDAGGRRDRGRPGVSATPARSGWPPALRERPPARTRPSTAPANPVVQRLLDRWTGRLREVLGPVDGTVVDVGVGEGLVPRAHAAGDGVRPRGAGSSTGYDKARLARAAAEARRRGRRRRHAAVPRRRRPTS